MGIQLSKNFKTQLNREIIDWVDCNIDGLGSEQEREMTTFLDIHIWPTVERRTNVAIMKWLRQQLDKEIIELHKAIKSEAKR